MVEVFTSVRACAAQLCAALLAAMMCGCFSLSLTHEIGGAIAKGPLGGKYSIKNVEPQLSEALMRQAPPSIVFTVDDTLDSIPLEVCVSDIIEEKYTTSSVQFLPGLLTLCTFPSLMEESRSHTVSISSPLGKHDIGINIVGRETVCWTPLGWMPFAYPLDGYDYTGGDLMDTWSDDKKVAWTKATINAVAKTVISTLTKARYDAYMKELANNARKKKIAEEANHRENVLRMAERGWPQESTLRDFAVKETTGLWDVIVSFRAEISIRKNRLQMLSDAIRGFGRKPDEDADYIKCKGEYDAARSALVQIFKSLENAYLAASKNAVLYESAEAHARTRKAVDECSRIAIDAADRILKHK
ncbi:MAG: hypothetical protein IKL96_07110 [Kiritimatiellae bacterium]|nr:hypothetical protein [Kiritimatiellia bacterium]